MKPVWSIKAVRCVCVLILHQNHPGSPCLPLSLQANPKAKRKMKLPALQWTFSTVFEIRGTSFHTPVNSDWFKSADKPFCRCTGHPHSAGQKDSEQLDRISRAMENRLTAGSSLSEANQGHNELQEQVGHSVLFSWDSRSQPVAALAELCLGMLVSRVSFFPSLAGYGSNEYFLPGKSLMKACWLWKCTSLMPVRKGSDLCWAQKTGLDASVMSPSISPVCVNVNCPCQGLGRSFRFLLEASGKVQAERTGFWV